MVVFMDESGELGFSQGSSNHYVITCLYSEDSKRLANRFRRYKARLIRAGWPKELEPKAATLFNSRRDQKVPNSFTYKNDPVPEIIRFLSGLGEQEISIDAIVINKRNIEARLRTLPFGILHNYFAGQILLSQITQYDPLHLFVDQRSKERHHHLHFDGYIETRAYMEKGERFDFSIRHEDSRKVYGLSTVDYVSWAINRAYEFRDPRFFKCIRRKINDLQRWFFR